MRLSSAFLVLPVLAAAQGQVPIKDQVHGWINKAKGLLPGGAPVPVPSGAPEASLRASKSVVPVTWDNWSSLLAPVSVASSTASQEWLIFITGGYRHGSEQCEEAEQVWNVSVMMRSHSHGSQCCSRVPDLGICAPFRS